MAIEDATKLNIRQEQNEKIDLKILVADDEGSIRELAERILLMKYSSVESVVNGKLLVEKLSDPNTKVDIIITDYNMPEMDGLEAIKKIRSMDHLKDIPIIMTTTDSSDSLQAELKALNVVFLAKPYTLKNLSDTVERLRIKK